MFSQSLCYPSAEFYSYSNLFWFAVSLKLFNYLIIRVLLSVIFHSQIENSAMWALCGYSLY